MLIHYLLKKLSTFSTLVSISCISIDVMTLLGGIFSRYVFGASPIWIDELSRYLMIGAVMLIAGVTLEQKQHMQLNIIDKLSSKKIKRCVHIYQNIIITVIFSFMTYFSFNYAVSIHNFTTIGLAISKTIPMLSIPIGFCSLLIYSSVTLFHSLFNYQENL